MKKLVHDMEQCRRQEDQFHETSQENRELKKVLEELQVTQQENEKTILKLQVSSASKTTEEEDFDPQGKDGLTMRGRYQLLESKNQQLHAQARVRIEQCSRQQSRQPWMRATGRTKPESEPAGVGKCGRCLPLSVHGHLGHRPCSVHGYRCSVKISLAACETQ